MATALTAQLAKIAATSSNALDLKAQRKAHAQSLIFEAGPAAAQDFETLYAYCLKGFQELCALDPRLNAFSRNLFAAHAVAQDRAQMTQAQNYELDQVLEQCLRMTGPWLHLKPGIKVVEWLVRRFRVHEFNARCLILAFLSCYSKPLFVTLLSILPKRLDLTFKFLHPYKEALTNPPRHALVYAATHHEAFFAAWNAHVQLCCQERTYSKSGLANWATIITESVVGQLDATQLGRRAVQQGQENNVIRRLLPLLDEGLQAQAVPDLRIACLMIITVLASRTQLAPDTVAAFTSAAISNSVTAHHGAELICVAALCQGQEDSRLPRDVYHALIAMPQLAPDLITIAQQYKIDRLVVALVKSAMRDSHHSNQLVAADLLRIAVEHDLLAPMQLRSIGKELALNVKGDDEPNAELSSWNGLEGMAQAIQHAGLSTECLNLLEEGQGPAGPSIPLPLRESRRKKRKRAKLEQPQSSDQRPEAVVSSGYKALPAPDSSLLLRDLLTEVWATQDSCFQASSHDRYYHLKSLIVQNPIIFGDGVSDWKGLDLWDATEPRHFRAFALSFCLRFGLSEVDPSLRASTIKALVRYLEKETLDVDLQQTIPYVCCLLVDQSQTVRSATIDLTEALLSWQKQLHASSVPTMLELHEPSKHNVKAISGRLTLTESIGAFDVLCADLEECLADPKHLHSVLDAMLSRHGSRSNSGKSSSLSQPAQSKLVKWLFAQTLNTQSLRSKKSLMELLEPWRKRASVDESIFTQLVQVVSGFEAFQETLKKDHLDQHAFLSSFWRLIEPGTTIHINYLLETLVNEQSNETVRQAASKRLTEVWTSLSHQTQINVAERLFVASSADATSRSGSVTAGQEALSALDLSSDILLRLLEKVPIGTVRQLQVSPTNQAKTITNADAVSMSSEQRNLASDMLERLTRILEFVSANNSSPSSALCSALLHVLGELQLFRTRLEIDAIYATSTALSALRKLIDALPVAEASKLALQPQHVDLVIDCFTSAANPQVQREGLLLIASLARLVPEQVCHRIMPVFTFMGEAVVDSADDYSVLVVDRVIDAIIPPLLASMRKKKGGPLAGSSEIILIFVAAFDHIPSSRRVGLFKSLISKVGPENSIYVLITGLVERHHLDKVLPFILEIILAQPSNIQILTSAKVLDVVLDCLKKKPTIAKMLLSSQDLPSRARVAQTLMRFLTTYLKRPQLRARCSKTMLRSSDSAEALRAAYSHLVRTCLQLEQDVRAMPKLESAYEAMLDSGLNLLALSDSAPSFQQLLENGTVQLQSQVLRELVKLIGSSKDTSPASQNACIALLKNMQTFASQESDPTVRTLAIKCLDFITERFARARPQTFEEVASCISGPTCLGSENTTISSISLLCLTTLADAMQEAFIPVAPPALSGCIQQLASILASATLSDDLFRAACSFLSTLLLNLPWLFSADQLDGVLELLALSTSLDLSADSTQSRRDLIELMGKQVGAQDMFAVLQRTWERFAVQGPEATHEYLELLRVAIARHNKATITRHAQLLERLFSQLFTIRAVASSIMNDSTLKYDEASLVEVDDSIAAALLQVIYKLNDAVFRPLFLQMLDQVEGRKLSDVRGTNVLQCRLPWMSFLHLFFTDLKSIVTSYAGLIIPQFTAILQGSSHVTPEHQLLSRRALLALGAAFEHDQDGYWQNPDRFEAIAPILKAQFANLTKTTDAEPLQSAITALAGALTAPEPRKTLNKDLLMHLRAEDAHVRLAAAQCQTRITLAQGEEWLALLPEMLPFISEALEDDDERVEDQVRQWVASIEEVLGESLDSMLQ